ncbi:hypothetical protein [Bifidobacterium oedipodis]|uniref:Uncharacterized protein n=1 Tax=Bifidobacterium oedipodis TaxID=2675322 RepID=A0A7Y0EPA5_9BIFI|nr:hypothetical protein [Bifidobacterium sp. DSM 109957]NMM93950.1 hypothetical protein [Bifidobacterium sp. DSM 109957]
MTDPTPQPVPAPEPQPQQPQAAPIQPQEQATQPLPPQQPEQPQYIQAPKYGAMIPDTPQPEQPQQDEPQATAVKRKPSKHTIIVAASLAAALIIGATGGWFARQPSFDSITAENDNLKSSLDSVRDTYDDTYQKLQDAESEVSKYDTIYNSVTDLENQKHDLEQELKALQGQYDQAKGEPIQLPAGEFTVGKEVPAGRYIISGSSNFKTFDIFGSVDINTILGDSAVGSGDYHGQLVKGYTIKNYAPATLTPVS